MDELKAAFGAVADARMVKGFAVGRTITSNACERWLAGTMGDQEAIDDMATSFAALCDAWLAMRERKAA
jgi:5-dehydro-2-deoxygluconokinase